MHLLLLALAPACVLLFYIWKKDKSEKEPPGLLLLLFFGGVLSCLPASILETLLITPIEQAFGFDDATTIADGGVSFVIGSFLEYFFGVALVEEGLKFLVMFLLTHKSRHFNSLFDGMIYAIFVSLGFAAFENIFYVFDYGVGTALVRAVMSVPGHMFFAVFMGYYYSMWHLYKTANTVENS